MIFTCDFFESTSNTPFIRSVIQGDKEEDSICANSLWFGLPRLRPLTLKSIHGDDDTWLSTEFSFSMSIQFSPNLNWLIKLLNANYSINLTTVAALPIAFRRTTS
jgi:hypothetical protein